MYCTVNMDHNNCFVFITTQTSQLCPVKYTVWIIFYKPLMHKNIVKLHIWQKI
jgi:hypothetical protein